MKKIVILAFACILFAACGKSDNKKIQNVQSTPAAKVNVYYFHGEARCPTCIGIEKVTKEIITKYFKNNKDVQYQTIDFSKKGNETLADKYEVAFSSLIIATTSNHSDLTEVAFATALSNPDSLSNLIKNTIDEYLK